MALADIVARITDDAVHEADAVLQEAREAAGRVTAAAEATAAGERTRIMSEARDRAEQDARTKLARARITARDRSLAARRELVERAVAEAAARLEKLSDAEYVVLIAREVVDSARGGERLRIAAADRERLAGPLADALAAAGVHVEIAGTADSLARGVLLEGDRMRTEISPAAIVASRADALTSLVAEVLFGDES